MPRVIMLRVIMLNAIMLNVIVLNVIMLNVVMLNVSVVNVAAPLNDLHFLSSKIVSLRLKLYLLSFLTAAK